MKFAIHGFSRKNFVSHKKIKFIFVRTANFPDTCILNIKNSQNAIPKKIPNGWICLPLTSHSHVFFCTQEYNILLTNMHKYKCKWFHEMRYLSLSTLNFWLIIVRVHEHDEKIHKSLADESRWDVCKKFYWHNIFLIAPR